MHLHKWQELGKHYIQDALFSKPNELHSTGYPIRFCARCKKYQYKDLRWQDCEIAGLGNEFYLCGKDFREYRGLAGKVSPRYDSVITLEPVK